MHSRKGNVSPPAFRQCSIWRSPRGKSQWSVATRQAEQIAKLIIITGNAPQIRGRRHQKWQPGRDIASASARAGLLRLRLWREYGKSIRAANFKLASHARTYSTEYIHTRMYVGLQSSGNLGFRHSVSRAPEWVFPGIISTNWINCLCQQQISLSRGELRLTFVNRNGTRRAVLAWGHNPEF